MDFWHGVVPEIELARIDALDRAVSQEQGNGLRRQLWGRTLNMNTTLSGVAQPITCIDIRFPMPVELALEMRVDRWQQGGDGAHVVAPAAPSDTFACDFIVTIGVGEATDQRIYAGRPPRFLRAQSLVVQARPRTGADLQFSLWAAPGRSTLPQVIQEARANFGAAARTAQLRDPATGNFLDRWPDEATHIRCAAACTPITPTVACSFYVECVPPGFAQSQWLPIVTYYPSGPAGYFGSGGTPLPMMLGGAPTVGRAFNTANAEELYVQFLKA